MLYLQYRSIELWCKSVTKQEMERQVALLLTKQRELRRLDLELSPNQLMLLQRLLYRLGWTKMSRIKSIKYARLTLSAPRAGVSFGGEPVNEHDLHDESGKVVGNVKLRDRGHILHVDWIGGKGAYAGSNTLGNEAMRSVRDSLAAHYPNAQYLSGHRISGFRHTAERVMVPIKRTTKMSRKPSIQYGRMKTTYPDIVSHAAKALENPLDDVVVQSFADHLAETHPDEPAVHEFTNWINGTPISGELAHTLAREQYHARYGNLPTNRRILYIHRGSRSIGHEGQPTFAKSPKSKNWRSTIVGDVPTDTQINPNDRKQYTSSHVANEVYRRGGPRSLIATIMGARALHPNKPNKSEPGRPTQAKFSRKKPIRYAKFNHSTPAHPLVAGFPIEHALRHVANSPHSSNNSKDLAVAALKGHTEALWGLHDSLHEDNEGKGHPILKAAYNWLNAADKLHLDKHTYTALTEAAERRRAEEPHAEHRVHGGQYLWRYTPESHAIAASFGLRPEDRGSVRGEMANTVRNRIKELSPTSTDEEITESIRRHSHRAVQESQRRITGTSPDESSGHAVTEPGGDKNEIATRYSKGKPTKYSLANKSNFIGALLKSSSPQHKMFVQRTKELARRAGAKQTKEFPALHDTPNQAVPGVAMAVYGHIQPDAAHALGSWVNGLLPNSPGYAVFHTRPTGPDTLYRIRMEGSGYDARAKLDRAGIQSRVFVPHKKGLDILIPDKGNRMAQSVEAFATQQKAALESSPGHLTTVGSQDQGQARDTFRNKIATHESKQMSRSKKYAGRVVWDSLGAGPDNVHRNFIWNYEPDKSTTSPPIKVTKPGMGKKPNPFGAHMDEIYSDEREAPQTFPPGVKVGKYQPGMQPPKSPTMVDKLPKGIKEKTWNPTMVPPNSKPLFSSAEYNKLHKWAHQHAFTHAPAFSKFLGSSNPRDPNIHDLLVKSIIHAAHEMRRSGKTSVTAGIGNTSKRLKINIPRISWVNVKTSPKLYNPPKAKLSRFAQRRIEYRRYARACR